MSRGYLLAKTYGRALCVVQDIILNYPTKAPIRADHSYLLGGGWRPWRCGVSHLKAAHGYVIHACFLRVKAALAHVYLNDLAIRVVLAEITVKQSDVVTHLGIPLINRLLRVQYPLLSPGMMIPLGAHFRLAKIIKA